MTRILTALLALCVTVQAQMLQPIVATKTQNLTNLIEVVGDSRTANGAGATTHTSGSSYSVTLSTGFGYAGCLPIVLNNLVYFDAAGNFGVGAQSTAGIRARLSTPGYSSSGSAPSPYLGADGTATATDTYLNTGSSGAYSSVTHPAKLVILLAGTNDVGRLGPKSGQIQKQSMLNIAAMLDAYGVVGKTVFLANEIPTGVALGYNETYTVPAGGGTYTTAHAATYAKDWYVSYLPTPGGTKDGVTLTKVASNPGAGQYSVTAGAYTFSAADAGARVLVNYYWYASGKGGNTPYHVAVHNWLSSRAANFVDTGNTNIDYGIPGALYGRPWVVSVDTWGAMADPSAPTQNDGRVLTDGLHPSVTGCMVIAEAFAEQIRKHLPSADFSHLATMPTTYVGTPSSGLGNGVIKTFTGTYPKTPISSGTFSITAAGIVASDNNGSLAGAGVTTGTINYSTGAYSVTFDAAPALNTPVVVTADSGQLLVNNFLYFAGSGSVTSILGCSTECQNSDNLTSSNGTGKPAIFTTSLDSTTGGSAGPLATGAMKIDIVENDTSSDGYPELVVKLSGMTGSSKLTLTLSQPAIKNLTVGSKYRTSAVVKISAGPNGHLYGLESSNLISRCQSGASFTPVGEAASISTYHSGQFNLGNTGNPYSDNDIAGGELRLPLLSPACDTTGMTSPTGAFSLVLGAPANTPISATIRLSRFSFKAYSY